MIEEEFEGEKVLIREIDGNRVITTAEVAKALGVKRNSISSTYSRNKDEFIEGEDSFVSQIATRKKRVFTKTGIIKLCFLIKSQKAKTFRQWASRILSNIMDGTYEIHDSRTGEKVEVLAELLEMQAAANYPEAAERIREAYGEELPPPPKKEDFARVLAKEGADFGASWLLDLKTLPTAKRVVRVAPGIGPTSPKKKRRKARRRM